MNASKSFDGKYRTALEQSGVPYKLRDHITDLIGVRVVCIYESDIEKIAALVKSQFIVIGETNKSAQIEMNGNEFGYKGLHLDLKLNELRVGLPEYAGIGELVFELQIRTIVQDAWSEVDHKLKYKKQTPIDLQRRISRLAALFELADQEFEAVRNISSQLEDDARSPNSVIDEENTNLDIFGFIRVSAAEFPSFVFQGEALEGILSDIQQASPNLKIANFRQAVSSGMATVKLYFEYMLTQGHKSSPYTIIRHALYLSNLEIFRNMIFDSHRGNFDRWLEHKTVHPREVESNKRKKT